MSSDFFVFDEPLYNYQQNQQQHSNPIQMFDSDTLFLSDPSIDDILQEPNTIPNTQVNTNLTQAQSLDQIAQTLLSNSSPIDEMESLSLQQQTQFTQQPISSDLANGYAECPVSGIKTEEPQIPLGFESPPSSDAYFPGSQSFGGSSGESLMIRFLQRSYSYGGDSYDGEKQGTLFQPPFGTLFESPEIGFSFGQSGGLMRRVSSTGDLPKTRSNQATQKVGSTVLGSESTTTTLSFMEDANFKVGRYSVEERKERIDRYRAKRTQRNFNKTIKYACRKTLADTRLRIRGRFARNDESHEPAKSSTWFNRCDVEDDLWGDCLHEKGDHEGKMNGYGNDGDQRRQFMHHFGGSSSKFDEYSAIEY